MQDKQKDTPVTGGPSDQLEDLAAQAREAVEKNASELRKRHVPIATEPPTVFRP